MFFWFPRWKLIIPGGIFLNEWFFNSVRHDLLCFFFKGVGGKRNLLDETSWFFVKSYFDFIFWNNLVPLCKQVKKKSIIFFSLLITPLCKNISFFFVLSLKTKWKLETNFGFIWRHFPAFFTCYKKFISLLIFEIRL